MSAESKARSKERYRRWRENNLEHLREYNRQYHRDRKREYTDKDRVLRLSQHVRKKYGVTLAEYEAMCASQGGVCAICKCPESAGKNKSKSPDRKEVKRLSLDHCHTTGKLRGFLCHRCNVMIGYAKDSPVLMRLAAEYLDKHAASAATS